MMEEMFRKDWTPKAIRANVSSESRLTKMITLTALIVLVVAYGIAKQLAAPKASRRADWFEQEMAHLGVQ
jgi:hypothetical protein